MCVVSTAFSLLHEFSHATRDGNRILIYHACNVHLCQVNGNVTSSGNISTVVRALIGKRGDSYLGCITGPFARSSLRGPRSAARCLNGIPEAYKCGSLEEVRFSVDAENAAMGLCMASLRGGARGKRVEVLAVPGLLASWCRHTPTQEGEQGWSEASILDGKSVGLKKQRACLSFLQTGVSPQVRLTSSSVRLLFRPRKRTKPTYRQTLLSRILMRNRLAALMSSNNGESD